MSHSTLSWLSLSPEETEQLGALLAPRLAPGDVLALDGDLGAGKTALARGLGRGLGLDPTEITSPTFALVHLYPGGRLPFYHYDVYRLEGPEAFQAAGFAEDLDAGGVSLLEWAKQVAPCLPPETLWLSLDRDFPSLDVGAFLAGGAVDLSATTEPPRRITFRLTARWAERLAPLWPLLPHPPVLEETPC